MGAKLRLLPAAREAVSGLPTADAKAALVTLEIGLEGPLREIVVNANRSSLVSLRPTRDRRALSLRLHWCFLQRGEQVVEDLLDLLRPPGPSPSQRKAIIHRLREHYSAHGAATRSPKRPPALRPQGRTLDLEALRDEINQQYFGGELKVAITWGRHGGSSPRRRRGRGRHRQHHQKRRRVLRLGSYNSDQELVRIHPVLDRPGVPRYVVASVVHHELLHAAMPVTLAGGRRRLHPPEFRRRERLFADHQRATDWLDRHLDDLLDARDSR
ncbi:MAG: hypothetical protein AAGD01_16025 [Acidobacteriota bacterium]